MFEFHADRKRYFEIQIENTRDYVLPFIEQAFPLQKGMRVLEIGCGEGGVLKAFVDRGCFGEGVEMDESRLVNARIWMQKELQEGRVVFHSKDIYTVTPTEFGGLFDIVLLKDVIEHIHDQPRLMAWMKSFLVPGGVIFFGFPPWQMPFGGHQQLCRNKWLSKLPYYHLLPAPVYKRILKAFGEPWKDLMEIKETGISIERFEEICHDKGFRILSKKHYLLNPIYKYKFGWQPKEQSAVVSSIPFVRNFFTSCVYYLIRVKNKNT
jgi:SAM-dependent methyltransferase